MSQERHVSGQVTNTRSSLVGEKISGAPCKLVDWHIWASRQTQAGVVSLVRAGSAVHHANLLTGLSVLQQVMSYYSDSEGSFLLSERDFCATHWWLEFQSTRILTPMLTQSSWMLSMDSHLDS